MATSHRVGTTAAAAVSTFLVGGSLLCCFNSKNNDSNSMGKHDGRNRNEQRLSRVDEFGSGGGTGSGSGNQSESWNILRRSLQVHNNNESNRYNYNDYNRKNLNFTSSSVLFNVLPGPFFSSNITSCDSSSKSTNKTNNNNNNTNNNEELVDDGYPNFKRHGKHAILPKYLTPEIYQQLKDKKTKSGVTLNDIITSGVSLPMGARPPRGGFGIFAGDAESYRVFAPLFFPLLEYHHGIQLTKQSKFLPPRPSPTTTTTTNSSGSTTTTRRVSREQQQQFIYQRPSGYRLPRIVESKHTKKIDSNDNDNDNNSKNKMKTASRLRRHVTNLNPEYVLSQNIDPSGQYILYTRMRLSRSVEGFAFSPTISRQRRRELERLIQSCMDDWKNEEEREKKKGEDTTSSDDSTNSSSLTQQKTHHTHTHSFHDDGDNLDTSSTTPNKEWLSLAAKGKYSSVLDMSNSEHDDLIQRHVLFEDPDEYSIAAGIGRDWPDARGVYYDNWENPEVMIWYNSEDHLRIISLRKGGDLLGVFTRLSLAVSALEGSLQKRGHSFATDPQLGFLNTSPANVGTALRASVFVKLVRLGQQPGFRDLIHRLRLEATTRYDDYAPEFHTHKQQRYTGIFDIANAERLGQSEVQLINTMIHGVGRLIEIEKRLERGEKVDLSQIQI